MSIYTLSGIMYHIKICTVVYKYYLPAFVELVTGQVLITIRTPDPAPTITPRRTAQ